MPKKDKQTAPTDKTQESGAATPADSAHTADVRVPTEAQWAALLPFLDEKMLTAAGLHPNGAASAAAASSAAPSHATATRVEIEREAKNLFETLKDCVEVRDLCTPADDTSGK